MRLTPSVRWIMLEKDKRPEYATLMSNSRMKAILRTVKKAGKMPVWTIEALKYNNLRPGEDHSVVESGPREDGHYDVEGHSCCDVSTSWKLRPWNFSDLRSILKGAAEWWDDTKDLYSLRYLRRHPSAIKDLLGWVRDTWPLTHKCSGWTWTVDSMKVSYDEAAWDKAEEIVEERRPMRSAEQFQREVVEIYEETRRTITRQEVERFLEDSGMRQMSDRIWVSTTDPTVFVYDEAYRPFDMKDGWSEEAIAELIAEWCQEMLGDPIKVYHDPEGA